MEGKRSRLDSKLGREGWIKKVSPIIEPPNVRFSFSETSSTFGLVKGAYEKLFQPLLWYLQRSLYFSLPLALKSYPTYAFRNFQPFLASRFKCPLKKVGTLFALIVDTSRAM